MRVLKYFMLVVMLYILTPYILMFFPKKGANYPKKDRKIYFYYTPLHTNIILDVRDNRLFWERLLPDLLRGREFNYLEFGLGDKETYLTTKDLSDLKLETALKALFLNTNSLIDIFYLYDIDPLKLESIDVSEAQYRAVVSAILKSFGSKPKFISMGFSKYKNEALYGSVYTYNLFFTCNTWVDKVLKESNITAIWWTPFSYPLIWSLRR